VWSSQLGRAIGTATPCAQSTGLKLQIDARLRELDFGDGEGLTSQEMRSRFPAAYAAFEIDPVADHLPGGEDPAEAAHGFIACLRDIAGVHPDGRVLIVAHSTVIRLALCRLLGEPLSDYRRLFPRIGNCALTEARMTGPQPVLLQLNAPLEQS